MMNSALLAHSPGVCTDVMMLPESFSLLWQPFWLEILESPSSQRNVGPYRRDRAHCADWWHKQGTTDFSLVEAAKGL